MDRVSAARERVQSVRAEVVSVTEFPCIQCRHYSLACTHPAVGQVIPDPETGSVKLKSVAAADARAPDGACGPEGALFDARSPLGAAAVYMVSTTSGRWALGLSLFLLGCTLFG